MAKLIQTSSFILLILSLILSFLIQDPEMIPNYQGQHHEVLKTGNLLNDDGQLIDIGYSNRTLKTLNENQITSFLGPLTFLRYKKWDFFQLTTDRYIVGIAMADLGYAAASYAHIYEFISKKEYFIQHDIPFYAKPDLTPESLNFQGSFKYESPTYNYSIQNTDQFTKNITLKCQKYNVHINLVLKRNVDHEDIVMISPLSHDLKKFYYNAKSYNLPVEGQIFVDHNGHNIRQNYALAGYDIGRGVWNYKSYWLWITSQGFIQYNNQKTPIAINLGGGQTKQYDQLFQDNQVGNATEDSFFLNGKLFKLGNVKYDYNEQINSTWQLNTPQFSKPGDCKITFQQNHYCNNLNDFVLIKSQIQQYYGYFNGSVIIQQNGVQETIIFDKLYGFAEIQKARW